MTGLAPRANAELVGHADAERTLLQAWLSGRLPHAWLLAGPRGIGKATLAYRFARFVLLQGGPEADMFVPASLAVAADVPVFRRVAAGTHANLLSVDRFAPKPSRSRSEITVDAVREIGTFCRLTSGEQGWRVVVIDGAEDLNRNAENALLKLLEEPPPRAVLLLVSHAPGRLLPTTRSRCRTLRLRPLTDGQVGAVLDFLGGEATHDERAALVRLAAGSPGRALDLAGAAGLELYRALLRGLGGLGDGRLDAALAFVQKAAGKDESYRTACELLCGVLRRAVRRKALAAGGGDEEAEPAEEETATRALLARHDLPTWFALRDAAETLMAQGERLNLDRQQVLHSILVRLVDG